MVQPLFMVPACKTLVVDQVFILDGAEGKHAASVRRMRANELLQLTDGSGTRVMASVTANLGSSLELRIVSTSTEEANHNQITLVQALAKGDRDELAVQAATELGAAVFIPWQASRSISKWEGAKITKGVERWQTIANEASKQSLRVFSPKVSMPVSSSELAKLISGFDLFVVLEPTAESSLKALLPASGKIALVVGPEGGIEPAELTLFTASGAKLAHLGDGVLRTSTAGLAAIAVISAFGSSWD